MKILLFSLVTFTFVISNPTELLAQSRLNSLLNEVEEYISDRDRIAPEVSSVEVAWHLDHLLKVINGIHYSLSESDPDDYKYSWKFTRSVIFTIGRFPRGIAKSPKSALPPDVIDTDDIYKQLADARSKVIDFSRFDRKQHFNHGMFGMLNRNRALKFVEIHTRHHLRIIRDIVNKSKEDEALSK